MKKVEGIIEKDQDNVTKNSHNLPYDTLLQLIEHLKSCVDVASSRMMNWQKYCMKNPNILPFLFQISFKLDDGVSPIILHLLQSAICNTSTNMMPGGATSSRKRALSPMKNIRKPKNTTNTAEQSANEEPNNLNTSIPLVAQSMYSKRPSRMARNNQNGILDLELEST